MIIIIILIMTITTIITIMMMTTMIIIIQDNPWVHQYSLRGTRNPEYQPAATAHNRNATESP